LRAEEICHGGNINSADPLFPVVHQVSIAFIMSHSTAIPINITLDGHNYREWAFCVETALRGHGLLFHLTNAPPLTIAMLLKLRLGILIMEKSWQLLLIVSKNLLL
jgi:hypothetical protein